MHREDIDESLKTFAFDFFYLFSRFEFVLKENWFLKCKKEGVAAIPEWNDFVRHYADQFKHSDSSSRLLELSPKSQKVGSNQELIWREVGMDHCNNELCKTVTLLKTIRNNLFHGGKLESRGWDNPARIEELLTVGKSVLVDLAKLANWELTYPKNN